MTKKTAISKRLARTAKRGGGVHFVSIASAPNPDLVVKFGSVTIKTMKPDAATVTANVARGSDAFNKAVLKMASPGVVLEARPDVPTYRAAPDNPKLLIRRLGETEQVGEMRDGKFVTIE